MNNTNYLLIGIILVIVIYFNYKIKSIEKMSNTDATTIREAVKEVYKADVIALKNIGDVASSLLSSDKKILTLPFDEVKFAGKIFTKGDINTDANINVKNDINMENGKSIRGKGRLHIASGERLYLLPKNGTWLTKDWSSDANLIVHNDIKVPNLYTENIGKHQGDGWLRINNIGNSASVALFGTLSINEHKGKGGLNVGSWNEAGVGNGKIYSTGDVEGHNIRGRSDVITGNISLKNHRHDYVKNRFVGGFNGNRDEGRQTGRSRT